MQNVISPKSITDALLHPGQKFVRAESENFGPAFLQLLLLLAFCALFLVGSAAWNRTEIIKLNQAMRAMLPAGGSPAINALRDFIPWNQLLYSLLWLLYALSIGLFRHIALILVGVKDRSLALTQSIGLYAVIPLIFLGLFSGLGQNLFPQFPIATNSLSPRFFLTMTGVFIGFLWEAWIFVRGFQAACGVSAGRALFVYLAGASGFGFFSCGSILGIVALSFFG